MIGFSVGKLLTKMEGPPTTPVPNAMKPVGVICPLSGGGGDDGPRRRSSIYSRRLSRMLTIGDQPFM